MGGMSDMAVVLQERGTVYPWGHMGCMSDMAAVLPEELLTLGGNMACISDMAVLLQERGTAYP